MLDEILESPHACGTKRDLIRQTCGQNQLMFFICAAYPQRFRSFGLWYC